MAKIGLPKGSGKRLKVREKSVKSQGILKWILSGNPGLSTDKYLTIQIVNRSTINVFSNLRGHFNQCFFNMVC